MSLVANRLIFKMIRKLHHVHLQPIGYKLVMDDEARKFIANKGYDIQYGARPLKRAIQTHVEDALAEVILSNDIQEGDTIRGTYNKEKDAIVMTIEKWKIH